MKDDGFRTSRNLDRTVWVAAVDDVGRVRAGTERRRPRHERECAATAEGISNSIGLRGDLPYVLEKGLARVFRQTIPIEAGQHAQFWGSADLKAQFRRQASAGLRIVRLGSHLHAIASF